jgi:hypothetical protein
MSLIDSDSLSKASSLGKTAYLCIDSVDIPSEVAMELIKDQLRNHDLSPEALMKAEVLPADCIPPLVDALITIGAHPYDKYERVPDIVAANGDVTVSTRLSRAGQAAFSKDCDAAASALALRRNRFKKLVTWLWQSMGPDVKLALRNDSDAMDAVAASDVYKLWPCIMKAATTEGVMKSVSVLARTFSAMMSPGESHMIFVDRLQKLFNLFGILFESSDVQHKGYVKLETLYSVLYLNGLDKLTYEFIMNMVFSKVTDVNSLPPFKMVSQTIQTFMANHHAGPSAPITEPALSYVSSADDKKGGTIDCKVCRASFTPQQRNHDMCAPCAKKFFNDKRHAYAKDKKPKKETKALSAATSEPSINNMPFSQNFFTEEMCHLIAAQVAQRVHFALYYHLYGPCEPS